MNNGVRKYREEGYGNFLQPEFDFYFLSKFIKSPLWHTFTSSLHFLRRGLRMLALSAQKTYITYKSL